VLKYVGLVCSIFNLRCASDQIDLCSKSAVYIELSGEVQLHFLDEFPE
jgi:hypothetical protein